MITSFKHKGLEAFYRTGKTAGIQARHAEKLRLILTMLEHATGPDDMSAPGLKLHPLKQNRKGEWSVTVQANWRVTFKFVPEGVELVNYEDYH